MPRISITISDKALAIIDLQAKRIFQGRRSPAVDFILKEFGRRK